MRELYVNVQDFKNYAKSATNTRRLWIGRLERAKDSIWFIRDIYNYKNQDISSITWVEAEIGEVELKALYHMGVDTWCQKIWEMTSIKTELQDHKDVYKAVHSLFKNIE